jgi:hypothetical protein
VSSRHRTSLYRGTSFQMSRIYITYEVMKSYGKVVRILSEMIPEFRYKIQRDDIGGFYFRIWLEKDDEEA